MANTYLTRTFGSSPSTTLFTWSAWVKRTKLGTQQAMISGCSSHGANTGQLIYFTNDDKLAYYAQASGTVKCNLITNAQFRDTNAWYHIVLKVDSSQSNVANRVVFYVNNVEQSYTTTVEHAQNWDAYFMLTTPTDVGRNGMNTSDYFDGVMSHMHMTHGYNYTPSTFGSVDATTGEWKINTSPTVNYNSNGFFILKDGNTGTDHSGNSETFSSGGGTLTKTEDNPSNVFATINALDNYRFNGTFSNGNNTVASNASVESYWTSSLGASSGKYYWEVKISASGSDKEFIGIADKVAEATDFSPYSGNNKMRSYYGSTGVSVVGSTGTAFGATFGAGDIIGVAMDLDNHKIYYSKNGVFQGSGNPSTGANGLDIDTSPASGFYYAQGANIHNTASTFQTNFGNGYFGTTAVSSAGTNASNNGIFEYDVPSGFTALSTKGLNL
ncbi:hypothetical protein Skadi4_14 [Pelagibacter phage Skadi-4 EXVC104P]|nr:hypothetical protein Skadi5_56 [Pelagibacter phage Skadi-5 EXVC105P]UWJ03795.1 hypothetical protein Skadi6_45 [Pelagibacter phage Skadi-6 EXVC106P]UWJ03864.1 hypothetical protein Skadi10_56 [Pelagibacter phage Skadi-10 EXVC110P]UWJ03922.1 hypothetical protein Skadi8_56 [Pelagibacter phage Skadi-8 EXVC108P]UWJ03956.1 hypothetical protein Skadi3_32 [Pelagibacter phage Skadi-3 EXVC103P]UWJ04049.1 hypothetical protein Skadi2_52 [Pelagibacter phage Skadi-2 EXVC102P]UWJ04101.1 hypothetical prote